MTGPNTAQDVVWSADYNPFGEATITALNGFTNNLRFPGQYFDAETDLSGNTTAEYVYLNGVPLAKIEGNSVYYYANDHLGTPQKVTDSSGTVVWVADYKPFGEATITVSTLTNNLRGKGQYFDAETGLDYNYFRDYNPITGKYLQADRIGIGGGINLYLYVGNNPINRIDLYGLMDGGPDGGGFYPGYYDPLRDNPNINNNNSNVSTSQMIAGGAVIVGGVVLAAVGGAVIWATLAEVGEATGGWAILEGLIATAHTGQGIAYIGAGGAAVAAGTNMAATGSWSGNSGNKNGGSTIDAMPCH